MIWKGGPVSLCKKKMRTCHSRGDGSKRKEADDVAELHIWTWVTAMTILMMRD